MWINKDDYDLMKHDIESYKHLYYDYKNKLYDICYKLGTYNTYTLAWAYYDSTHYFVMDKLDKLKSIETKYENLELKKELQEQIDILNLKLKSVNINFENKDYIKIVINYKEYLDYDYNNPKDQAEYIMNKMSRELIELMNHLDKVDKGEQNE